jgi:exopolyphosphatase/guanosine-5'-triphosphate,3'-diphosphate pyrophosphatase
LLELVGSLGQEDVRERTITRLCERYAVDREQTARVEATSLALAEPLAALWDLSPREFRMLRWASRVHEIGQALSFGGYHRHGAYILANSDMPGFSEQGQSYLSVLVRAHRRRLHPEKLAMLRVVDGERAVRVAALFRLAVRLNRARSSEPVPAPVVRLFESKLELEFVKGFLDASPMTRADLEDEQLLLRAAGLELLFR